MTEPPSQPAPTAAIEPPLPRWRAVLRVLVAVLTPFVASRLIVFVFASLGYQAIIQPPLVTPTMTPVPAEKRFGGLHQWDAEHYTAIARSGYEFKADKLQHNVAFFPLYPLLTRAVAAAMPGEEDQPFICAEAFVSHVAALAAMFLLYAFVRRVGDHVAASWAVCLACFYPPSLFFSAGYTESLFLALVVGSGLAAMAGRYWPAAIILGVASACRPTAVAFLPTLLLLAWFDRKRSGGVGVKIARTAGLAALSVTGTIAYLVYLRSTFGRWDVYFANAGAWKLPTRGEFSVGGVLTLQPWWHRVQLLLDCFTADGVRFDEIVAPYQPLVLWLPAAVIIAVLALIFDRSRLRVFHLIPLLVVAIPYWQSQGTFPMFESIPRFLTSAYPLYVVCGIWLARGRHAGIGATCVGFMAALLAFAAFVFGHGQFVGSFVG